MFISLARQILSWQQRAGGSAPSVLSTVSKQMRRHYVRRTIERLPCLFFTMLRLCLAIDNVQLLRQRPLSILLHDVDLSGQIYARSVGPINSSWSWWELYNLHVLGHDCCGGSVFCRSWATYHNGRSGSRQYRSWSIYVSDVWFRSWSIYLSYVWYRWYRSWSVCPTCDLSIQRVI